MLRRPSACESMLRFPVARSPTARRRDQAVGIVHRLPGVAGIHGDDSVGIAAAFIALIEFAP